MTVQNMIQYLHDKKILFKDGNRYVLSKTAEAFIDVKSTKFKINIKQLATDLRNIYPAGIKSGNFYVKSPQADVEKKLKAFFNRYPEFTADQVRVAVTNYVFNLSKVNYSYMKLLQYFILKDGESMLAAHIENLDAETKREEEDFKGDVV